TIRAVRPRRARDDADGNTVEATGGNSLGGRPVFARSRLNHRPYSTRAAQAARWLRHLHGVNSMTPDINFEVQQGLPVRSFSAAPAAFGESRHSVTSSIPTPSVDWKTCLEPRNPRSSK